MPDSVRQRIITAVLARFAAITTANGFQTDIGENVTEWNLIPIQERLLSGVDVSDPKDTAEPAVSNSGEDHELTLKATHHWKSGDATPENLRKATADIFRAIGLDRYWHENTTISAGPIATKSGSALARNGTVADVDQMDLSQGGKIVGAAQVTFRIRYRTETLNPYVLK